MQRLRTYFCFNSKNKYVKILSDSYQTTDITLYPSPGMAIVMQAVPGLLIYKTEVQDGKGKNRLFIHENKRKKYNSTQEENHEQRYQYF